MSGADGVGGSSSDPPGLGGTSRQTCGSLLSHAYVLEVAEEAETLIKERYHPALLRLYRTLDAK